MQIDGFDWDDGNWPKCGKHGVGRETIEAAFENTPSAFPNLRHGSDEVRYSAIGRVDGRWLFIVFVIRNARIWPVSARFMHAREVRRYEDR